MTSGVGPFYGFVDDFSFLEEEETVKLFPASGVVVPTTPWNWVLWMVSILRFCIITASELEKEG